MFIKYKPTLWNTLLYIVKTFGICNGNDYTPPKKYTLWEKKKPPH